MSSGKDSRSPQDRKPFDYKAEARKMAAAARQREEELDKQFPMRLKKGSTHYGS